MTAFLGGYVLHAGLTAALPKAVDSLTMVCDRIVCVDSAPSSEAERWARSRGAEYLPYPWRGYGAARAHAAAALSDCRYLFYLDSDEHLEPSAAAAMMRWRDSAPELPFYRVRIADWAHLDGRRFLFRREHKRRVVRLDMARWQEAWIVHESLPAAPTGRLDITLHHALVDDLGAFRRGLRRYAMLWALRSVGEGRPFKSPGLHQALNVVKHGLIKGAVWRGGRAGLRLARSVAAYHGAKHRYARAVEQGWLSEALERWHAHDYAAVYREVDRVQGLCAAGVLPC